MRLDKYLADAGLGTRSELKQAIRKGRVSIGEKIVTDPGYAVPPAEKILYDGREISPQGLVYYMFYKPAGCICATKDREKTVLDYFSAADGRDLFPVGRLDKDTEGLLLVTNDGAFAHRITSPKKHVGKLYYFEADGVFDPQTIERIAAGMDIGKGENALPSEIAYLQPLAAQLPQGNLSPETAQTLLRGQIIRRQDCDTRGLLRITQGKYHQVKRMLKSCGVTVSYLKRLAIGDLYLDETLEKGMYRTLTAAECRLFDV